MHGLATIRRQNAHAVAVLTPKENIFSWNTLTDGEIKERLAITLADTRTTESDSYESIIKGVLWAKGVEKCRASDLAAQFALPENF